MSDGLNRVTLLGHLGQDPELKTIAGGQCVLNFSMATTESYLDRNNARQEKTEWHRCAIWGKRAEGLAKILTKGMKVYVEGSLSTRSWEKDGQKHYATDISVRELILCGGGKRDGGEQQQRAPSENRSYGGGGRSSARDPLDQTNRRENLDQTERPDRDRQGAPVGGGAHAPAPERHDDLADDPGGDDEIPF